MCRHLYCIRGQWRRGWWGGLRGVSGCEGEGRGGGRGGCLSWTVRGEMEWSTFTLRSEFSECQVAQPNLLLMLIGFIVLLIRMQQSRPAPFIHALIIITTSNLLRKARRRELERADLLFFRLTSHRFTQFFFPRMWCLSRSRPLAGTDNDRWQSVKLGLI